ncbi:MAG: PHP domain-containing protein [Betaproteobacteria bacterium]
MIDLHMHTTASDGRCTPPELVARAAAAGVRVMSVTDHDTLAGCAAAADACRAAGLTFVRGIEITSIRDGVDVHVLGYFLDADAPALQAFLAEQRQLRFDRVRAMLDRLATLGIALDAGAVLQPGLDDRARSVGRPWIARALVAGGYVATTSEAFDRWLARGRPAFVPRVGADPADVFARIHAAGGLASLAHPGLVGRDEWISGFVRDGADAIEAYHVDHDSGATRRYLTLADRLGVAVSGGSDYHGDPSHGSAGPGSVELPADAFARLEARARERRG